MNQFPILQTINNCTKYFILIVILQILISLPYISCLPTAKLSYVRIKDELKEVKSFKKHFLGNNIKLELKGMYLYQRPMMDFVTTIKIFNNSDSLKLFTHIENIKLIVDRTSVIWNRPHEDSIDSKYSENMVTIYKSFSLYSLSTTEKDYLRENEYPLKLILNDFLFVNDSAINFDTIYLTAPHVFK